MQQFLSILSFLYYIGCYVANGGTAGSPELIGDYNGARTQLDPNGQRDCFYWCIFDAPDAPYNFIALENGINCLCANQTNPNVNAIKRDDSECNVVALGTTDEAGGGDNRITLFRVEGYEDPSEEPGDSPDTTTSTTDTTTSTTDTTTSTIATNFCYDDIKVNDFNLYHSNWNRNRNVEDNDVNINLNHRNRDGNVDDHDLNLNLSHRHRNRNVVNSHNDVKVDHFHFNHSNGKQGASSSQYRYIPHLTGILTLHHRHVHHQAPPNTGSIHIHQYLALHHRHIQHQYIYIYIYLLHRHLALHHIHLDDPNNNHRPHNHHFHNVDADIDNIGSATICTSLFNLFCAQML
ncbi:hypothetical protein SNOG_03480 [Parastagonospora nodorum SN15]|uniref:Uncharacterized protein n=1 Tax=Phaeosphaeria nodorum (strain SN15 / ATCC MYA-4574 / FGSC 10173) TaxID=321614 RepID=Q0UXN4_PHANO|nr:hypothetical protein SNOG_03480 [Parastagonospora nodorum SN15]EAT88685.2 hypothetical protein SNOG_03480 [Parastagonospora nodorum SN15]